ncbi:MAG: TfuA-like protein [Pseudomonadota bacterium]
MIAACIFSGPTLPPFMIKEKLGYDLNENHEIVLDSGERIRFLPPVSEGDILRVIPQNPKVIGIIDGYFENVPSVWHKEILHAMSQGIHVLGASSMGALRAAELAPFGMEGVGAIFRAFADGFLEDDDEVTVVHGPREFGFPLLSEAMVNIRRTLEDARNQKILSPSDCEALVSIAKNLHYKNRSYGKILSLAEEQGHNGNDMNRFRNWLKEGRKDQKLVDALALLEKVIEKINAGIERKTVLYNFENTVIWKKNKSGSMEAIEWPKIKKTLE